MYDRLSAIKTKVRSADEKKAAGSNSAAGFGYERQYTYYDIGVQISTMIP